MMNIYEESTLNFWICGEGGNSMQRAPVADYRVWISIMPFIHVINQSIVVLINLSNSVENKHVNRKLQKKGGISIPLALVVGRRIKYMSALRFNSSTAGFKFSDV
jgi:hypothetical protein